jgi:hypothetical protein
MLRGGVLGFSGTSSRGLECNVELGLGSDVRAFTGLDQFYPDNIWGD